MDNFPVPLVEIETLSAATPDIQETQVLLWRMTISRRDESDNTSSDRGSVKFLLNSGTESFLEGFEFPSSHKRTVDLSHGAPSNNQNVQSPVKALSVPEFDFSWLGTDPVEWSFLDDELFHHTLSTPIGNGQRQFSEVFAPEFRSPSILPPGTHTVGMENEAVDPSFIAPAQAIIQGIFARAHTLNLDNQALGEVKSLLDSLLTAGRLQRLVKTYFECWHPHCPIVHAPSFHPGTVPLTLLVSVVFLGAVYSQYEEEVSAAKSLLDIAELYVYSTDFFTPEYEINLALRGSQPSASIEDDFEAFQHFQGAYLMVVVQFWAGSQTSRQRAMEHRFSQIIKVARKMNLTVAVHAMDECLNERSWIEKETRIRTMNILTLIDCAFSFFKNFPCRLSLAEIKFDLPCEEALFSIPHPFSDPQFQCSRHVTVYKAYQSLFQMQNRPREVALANHLYNGHAIPREASSPNPFRLNVLDMAILIHLLYAFLVTHMPLFSSTVLGNASDRPSNASFNAMKMALNNWASLWKSIQAQVPSEEWAKLGFYRNGYNFWLVAQLLLNKKKSVDVAMAMKVNCDDKLKQLKVLLQEDGD